MTGLVERAREKLDARCLVEGRLNKEGCRVLMTGAPAPRLVVDFDKPGSPRHPDAPHCDYLFIGEDVNGLDWVAPLELKRGRLHADEIVRQLQAGADAAERFVSESESIKFRPVAATGRTPKAERNRLRSKNNRIRLHGRMEMVRLLSCGEPLVRALG